jgi:hypothetical protein
MEIIIDAGGRCRCIYGEVIDLAKLGQLSICRASHVEPTEDGQWLVDLAPVLGPLLGPFSTRSAALAAENAWLETHWLVAGRD